MQNAMDMRALIVGKYILEHKCTLRDTAKAIGISKSTVHNDVHVRLEDIDSDLYRKVQDILDENLATRHIRGGKSTKNKYQILRDAKNSSDT